MLINKTAGSLCESRSIYPQVESKFTLWAEEEGPTPLLSWYTTMLVYKAADVSTCHYLLTRESFHDQPIHLHLTLKFQFL